MDQRYARQGFLGEDGQRAIETALVTINGLGGGGSIIAPEFAHLGFQNFDLFDPDMAKESNLNRTMTLVESDIAASTLKVEAARRRILEINSLAKVTTHACRWQDHPKPFHGSRFVVGCVDSFSERQQIEAACRRLRLPYIDIGMDVHSGGDGPPGISGQIILSMPGGPCMFCMGFLTKEKIGRDVANYGAAGGKPQVVWVNGMLASAAVGVAVNLLTNWTQASDALVYLIYDGNKGTLTPHIRLDYLPAGPCQHYLPDQAGDPVFVKL